MKYLNILTILGLLTTSVVNASRGDFFGENDDRAELFKMIDDHVGTIKLSLDENEWATMKSMTVLKPWDASYAPKYIANNVTMDFIVNGESKAQFGEGEFYFGLGGSGNRNYVKPGYNIKFDNTSLFGVKNLRIRSDIRDPTLLHEKLSADIVHKINIKSTSTGFVNLEVNGEDLGIFTVSNKVKKDFIKKYYDDKKTTNLYECKDDGSRFESGFIAKQCINIDEDLADQTDDIKAFNDAVNNAKSVEDLEKMMDVDDFLRNVAFEFIVLAWDNFISCSHNYFWYKRKDGKWIYILNDLDETFGEDFGSYLYYFYHRFANRRYIPEADEINIANIAIRDIENDHKILKYLIHDDDTRFRRIVADIVKTAFNPKVLFPRIDELVELIRDDVARSNSFDENGFCKGCINTDGFNPKWNITHFDETVGYVNWNWNPSTLIVFGLKYFIEERFKYLCHTYAINPETLELIEPRPKVAFWGIRNKYKPSFNGHDFLHDSVVRYTYPDLDKEDYKQEEYNADPENNDHPTNYEYPLHNYDYGYVHPPADDRTVFVPGRDDVPGTPFTGTSYAPEAPETSDAPETPETQETQETQESPETQETPEAPEAQETQEAPVQKECWSEALGYQCCKTSCKVYEKDEHGEWGYENGKWCGIPSTCDDDQCWSKKLGYSCCTSSCKAYEVDANGEWGYEDGHWCGILKENCTN
eukprot:jgi/Orpsp1_1/1183901/evm.model.c7180000087153.1